MKQLHLIVLVILMAACQLFVMPVYAQVSPQNISSVNVSTLTDAQIRTLLQQAQAAGLNDNQLIQKAQTGGMSVDQVSLLQKRISAIRLDNANNTAASGETSEQLISRKTNGTDTSRKADSTAQKAPPSRIFGANLFRNSNTTFEPNLKIATPVNYILGPDDQLDINVYGNSLVNWKLDVTPDGNINIPGIGILNVSGKTIEQATQSIKGKLAANNYAIGHGTTVQVSLGNIRSIKVIMVGEVVKPGTYTLSSLSTVFNALYAAGGPNDNGSFRQIEVIRNNRIVRRLDVYDFLVKGDQKNNIGLQDQDIIRVPVYRIRVELDGEVKHPALFEVLPGETLNDVLNFAGGFNDIAYTSLITVSQVANGQRRITDVPAADYKNYIPLAGDVYTVARILERIENRVTINGSVFRPGAYELQKNMTLLQLITKAAGVTEDAFMGIGTITRLKPDNSTEILSFNLKNILDKSEADIPLQREDLVSISSIFDLKDDYTVQINGAVRRNGTYAYADSMSVEDLIIKAGGFGEGASPLRIEVARRIYNSDPNAKNSAVSRVFVIDVDPKLSIAQAGFRLKPFDVVSVYILPGYETQRTVKVEGEVLYPGFYTLKSKDEKISDLIARAGGLTASANVEGGTLKRDNVAILGVDRNKTDISDVAQERVDRLDRVRHASKDSTADISLQNRNNYVGIDLKKILADPKSTLNIILEDGDLIRVPKQQQIVRVNGEVLYPSAIVYTDSKSFNGFVLNAGGYTPEALRRSAYVIYPNGTVKGTHKFLFFNVHPGVKPGSEIYIPKKPVKRGLTANEALGITTGIASLGAIILGIITLINRN